MWIRGVCVLVGISILRRRRPVQVHGNRCGGRRISHHGLLLLLLFDVTVRIRIRRVAVLLRWTGIAVG